MTRGSQCMSHFIPNDYLACVLWFLAHHTSIPSQHPSSKICRWSIKSLSDLLNFVYLLFWFFDCFVFLFFIFSLFFLFFFIFFLFFFIFFILFLFVFICFYFLCYLFLFVFICFFIFLYLFLFVTNPNSSLLDSALVLTEDLWYVQLIQYEIAWYSMMKWCCIRICLAG